jgi:oligosaccharyltransferase complex subunit alpha (ribophorin I)
MVREVEVSHWGSISVEEVYELQHAGARLKGGFSRFEYQLRRGAQTNSFRSLTATLPGQASNIYYRDQIGNISTSDIRVTKNGNLDLEVETRFPLFGGWQTQFYIGYSIPTELALFLVDDRHKLKFDFNTPFHDVWVEEMEMKVILPEGAVDIEVKSPYPAEETRSVRLVQNNPHSKP